MDPESEKDMENRQWKGERHQSFSREALEELSMDISKRWLGDYEGLEVIPGIIGTAMLGVSAADFSFAQLAKGKKSRP